MYFVYIIYSEKCNRHYIGYSADVATRLLRHNAGWVSATKNCKPFVIKAMKSFDTEIEARQEEYRIKKMKSRVYIEKLINCHW